MVVGLAPVHCEVTPINELMQRGMWIGGVWPYITLAAAVMHREYERLWLDVPRKLKRLLMSMGLGGDAGLTVLPAGPIL